MLFPLLPRILATSILLILSFPRPDLGFLSLICLVPLLSAASRVKTSGRAFLAGWIAGWVWFFISYSWVSHSISRFSDVPFPLDQGIIAFLAAVHALYPGLFTALVRPFLRGKGLWGLLFLPSIWVLLELARSWFPAPFPWLPLGAALWKTTPLRPLYSLMGVYGASFYVVLFNVFIFQILGRERRVRRVLGFVLAALVLFPLAGTLTSGSGSGERIRVGVVQGNFEQDLKWEETLVDEAIRVHVELTTEAIREGAQLVVWPETAVPFVLESEPAIAASLSRFAGKHDVHLIFGSPAFRIRGKEIFFYNRAYHLAPDGLREHYDKTILVPFGEYVPFKRLFGFVEKLVPGEGEFARGEWSGPMSTPAPCGVLICFEAAFPSLGRREVRDGSRILANITNDGWFGRTWGPHQHLALAAVRSAENGVPLLRAANTGISSVVDRKGRIVERIPLDTRGVIVTDVETGGKPTFYSRFGDWIVIVALTVITINIFCRIRQRRQKNGAD